MIDEDDNPNLDKWLEDKEMVFVELDKDELMSMIKPENRLDCYRVVIYRTGTACYKAHGRYTEEEFWTEEFTLNDLVRM